MTIAAWTSADWCCTCFPLPDPDTEVVEMDTIVSALFQHASRITEADRTALGPAMHVAHILVTRQGADGLWPARLNLRTGYAVGEKRSAAPIRLMRWLNQLLFSTEFGPTIRHAASGHPDLQELTCPLPFIPEEPSITEEPWDEDDLQHTQGE